jgi:hypothetical protein
MKRREKVVRNVRLTGPVSEQDFDDRFKKQNLKRYYMDWSIGGIHTREDEIRNKMADILLNTAYCLCLNAEKRADRMILYQGGTMMISNSRFVEGFGWNLVPDQEISYSYLNAPYQNESYAKELSKHRWLYSVYNRSVRNTNYYSVLWRYSPFEYCPSHVLEQIREVYQKMLVAFEPLIPQRLDMIVGAAMPYRQAQDEYLGKVTTLLTNGYTQVYKICEAYKASQIEESNHIYATATQNKYPEYADGFRMIELKRNIEVIDSMYPLLLYSLLPTGPYISTAVQTYSNQPLSPYSNWCSTIAEIHVEAIQCHLNMMLQLIPLRKELEIMNDPNVPLNDPVNVPLNVPLNDPVNVPLNDPVNVPLNVPVYTHANVPLNDPVNVPLNVPVYTHANVPLNSPSNSPSLTRGPKGKPRIPVRHTKKSQPRSRKVPGNAIGFGRAYTRKTTENKPFQNNALEKLRKKHSRYTKKK